MEVDWFDHSQRGRPLCPWRRVGLRITGSLSGIYIYIMYVYVYTERPVGSVSIDVLQCFSLIRTVLHQHNKHNCPLVALGKVRLVLLAYKTSFLRPVGVVLCNWVSQLIGKNWSWCGKCKYWRVVFSQWIKCWQFTVQLQQCLLKYECKITSLGYLIWPLPVVVWQKRLQ